MRPFVARRNGRIAARVLAVLDDRYCDHWGERLGHLVLFEALPDSVEETRRLLDAGCKWLAEGGARAARAGYGMLDLPFVIDDYDSLPPSILRQNPPYYHALLKGAGFETEKGWVDYRVEVRPQLVERWREAVRAAERAGFEIAPLNRRPREARAAELARTWNDSFSRHWGHTPSSEGEFRFLLQTLEPGGVLDTSVIACEGGKPVGLVWAMANGAAGARLTAGRRLAEAEKLNILAIGVRESARGKGVGFAMAARSYLELVRRGAKFLSYTLVLDDNWPSRRTAEKLGAEVRANYVTYRRAFGR